MVGTFAYVCRDYGPYKHFLQASWRVKDSTRRSKCVPPQSGGKATAMTGCAPQPAAIDILAENIENNIFLQYRSMVVYLSRLDHFVEQLGFSHVILWMSWMKTLKVGIFQEFSYVLSDLCIRVSNLVLQRDRRSAPRTSEPLPAHPNDLVQLSPRIFISTFNNKKSSYWQRAQRRKSMEQSRTSYVCAEIRQCQLKTHRKRLRTLCLQGRHWETLTNCCDHFVVGGPRCSLALQLWSWTSPYWTMRTSTELICPASHLPVFCILNSMKLCAGFTSLDSNHMNHMVQNSL